MVSTSAKFTLNKGTLEKKSVPSRRNESHLIKNPFPLARKTFHLLPLLGTEKSEENWLTPNFSNAF